MALEFSGNGSGDHVNVGTFNLPNGGTELTVCGWIYFNSFTIGDQRIISKATGQAEADHYMMLSSNGNTQMRFRLKTGATTTHFEDTATINTDQWYHMGVVYDGSNIIFYRDGQQNGSSAKTGGIDKGQDIEVRLGDNPGATRKEFDGRLADVRVYKMALSDADMQTIYTLKGSDGIYRKLQKQWLLMGVEEQTASGGNSVTDSMGDGHGTPAGTPTYKAGPIVSTVRKMV